MKVKVESEKIALKLNIQKTKIMASGPITSWQIDGKIMETVKYFIFLGSKTTADGDCSHEIKRHLLIEGKAMTNPGSILKSRDIILPTKVHLVKAMFLPVLMYGCESEWIPGVGDGQGGLACCDLWGSQRVGHDWVTELNWTELNGTRCHDLRFLNVER